MSHLVEMVVNSPSSPNHGKHVLVDLDAPRWNPMVDAMDERFVSAMVIETGTKGSIELENLIFPLPHQRKWKGEAE
jgi:hypothetical protein